MGSEMCIRDSGKAMGPNIRSYMGFLGFHSWITEAADAYEHGQKKCASKKGDIPLDVFQDYTRKNCVFECQAKSMFKKCGCLPYHYPEFHLANTGIWKEVSSTACNYTQLLCLSKAKGRLGYNSESMISFLKLVIIFKQMSFILTFFHRSIKLYLNMS